MRERQFIQAMVVRLRSLTGKDELELEEFMLYLEDKAWLGTWVEDWFTGRADSCFGEGAEWTR